jgi:hypothetical protein
MKEFGKQAITQVSLGSDEELSITVRKKVKGRRGKMLMIGLGEGGSFDLLRAVASLSKGAGELFINHIVPNRNRSNNEILITPAVTGVQSDILPRFNKELITLGLMLKIRNGWYMINPRAIFVSEKDADKADEQWELLKVKRQKVISTGS